MKKIKVNLFDQLINHSYGEYGFHTFSPFVEPEKIEYSKRHIPTSNISVYTDKSIFDRAAIQQDPATLKVAWLVECREVHPFAYEQIVLVEDLFDYIFTFDSTLLSRGSKYIMSMVGSSRIIDKHAKIFKKTKEVSFIISRKNQTSGHRLRHTLAEEVKKYPTVDFWGSAYRMMPQGEKIRALAEYRYSIVVENSKDKNYFTEKIVDCFRTGVIPIYWGTESVLEYFNKDGLVMFNKPEELCEILERIDVKYYQARIEAIRENFVLAQEWRSMDDTFAKQLNGVISDR